jgi:succinate dehydrogenase / fumarate reductase cytochrome b subunit
MPEEVIRDTGSGAGARVAPTRARPISPHLQIYRPQISSVLSIAHRITGVALAFGSILLVAWIAVLAMGSEERYAAFAAFLRGPLGMALLFGWSWALFYHLANGIRHLFWDAGLGFELTTMRRSGWAVVAASVALTAFAWFIGLTVLATRP